MNITPTNSKKNWTEFFTDTAYSIASSAAVRTQQIWDYTPQPIKTSLQAWQSASPTVRIPLKAAAIWFVPGGLFVQGAATVAAVWSETPQEVVRAVRGEPVNMMGHRLTITDGSPSSNIQKPLDKLSSKIEQCEAIASGELNAAVNTSPLSPAALEAKTNKNLETLIQKASYYSTLYSLHSYICKIDEENSYDSLISLVASASKLKSEGKKPSLWRLFYKKYKDRLSFPQIVKAGIFYFFCTYIPIIPNTVDAYMKNLLGVIRTRLKKDSVSRNQLIQQTIANNERLLGVTNGATKKFAKGEALKGSSGEALEGLPLNDYLVDALNKLIGVSDEELSPQFINALIDQYPTRIPFRFGEGVLNWIIPRILKKWVLPNVAVSLVQQGNEQLKQNGAVPVVVTDQNGIQKTEQRLRSHIPFFLALTETLVLQMKNLQIKLDEDRKKDPSVTPKSNSDDSINLIGTEGLPGFIANLIEAIHLSGPAKIPGEPNAADTIKDVAARVKKLDEEVPDELDARIKTGIQSGLVEGTHFLVNYLADPNNTEDMFAKLLGLLDGPFCREEPKTQKVWEREKNTYEDSKKQLRQLSKDIFKWIIDSAVEKAAGDIPAERTEAAAKAIFAEHKRNGLSTFGQLQISVAQIEEKLALSEQEWTEEQSLAVEINEICATLKDFKNIEEIEEEIDKLSGAEQASIRRVLAPIYQGANEVMESTLMLQQAEIEYAPNARNTDRFHKITTAILEIQEQLAINAADIKLPEVKAAIQRIQPQLAKLEKGRHLSAAQIEELTHLRQAISQQTATIETEQATLAHIQKLRALSNDLIASMNTPSRFDRKKQIPEMKRIINLVVPSAEGRTELLRMMQKIVDQDRTSSLEDLTQPLLAKLKGLETSQTEKTHHLIEALKAQNLSFGQLAETHEERLAIQKEREALTMKGVAQEIKRITSTLHTTITGSEKESQVQLRSENSKLILSTLGALFGMGAAIALRRVAPSYVAPALTGFLATGLYHSTDLLTGTPETVKNTIGKMVLGAGASGGAAIAAASVLPTAVAMPIFSLVQSHWLGNAAASIVEHNIEIPKNQAKARAVAQVTEIFDKAYDNILTSSIFYEGNRRLFMRDFVRTHRV